MSHHADILAFIVRSGRVYRRDRVTLTVDDGDALDVSRVGMLVRSQIMRGHCTLVLDAGVIRPSLSRVTPHSLEVLKVATKDDIRRLIRNVESLAGVSVEEFHQHIVRSFSA
jgi:diadenosine tetraphosphate (Ap4A) HIT family hydrolase